jgi:hypothetical protein
MPFARFIKTSEIFDKSTRGLKFSNLASRSAKGFKQLTRDRMIKGPHTGRLYARKRGAGFRRSHRASAVGQRPSPDTMTLITAVSDRRTGDFSAEVYIAEKINPTNGTLASDYAETLQEHLERPIMTAEDAVQAEIKMREDGEALVRTML